MRLGRHLSKAPFCFVLFDHIRQIGPVTRVFKAQNADTNSNKYVVLFLLYLVISEYS
jgi:hypothetical protein